MNEPAAAGPQAADEPVPQVADCLPADEPVRSHAAPAVAPVAEEFSPPVAANMLHVAPEPAGGDTPAPGAQPEAPPLERSAAQVSHREVAGEVPADGPARPQTASPEPAPT
ncbi:MAG: hypothetical protein J2P53_01830, partial [Bradyrhizobiaceae bacterium]|nr:hypothetical protein [Bradyrhizobiaceae bacterium]